jgi:pimeloyl-ACP methyl ester carboxylesterase
MASVSLELGDGSRVSGVEHLPRGESSFPLSHKSKPLLVLVHGGSCNAEFFDVNDEHSMRPFSELLGVPAVALNRPGYMETPALSEQTDLDPSITFIQRQARWLHGLALPAVWKRYSQSLTISSLVVYGSSIGGAITLVAAGLYGRESLPSYKLAGLVLSSMSAYPNSEPLKDYWATLKGSTKPFSLPVETRNALSFGKHAALFDPATLTSTKHHADMTGVEVYDINMQWPDYWRGYAETVSVQVLYTLGEFDDLWHVSPSNVRDFVSAFKNSPWVESRLMKNTPHVPEFSHQSSGFWLRVFGFALECAVSLTLDEEREAS